MLKSATGGTINLDKIIEQVNSYNVVRGLKPISRTKLIDLYYLPSIPADQIDAHNLAVASRRPAPVVLPIRQDHFKVTETERQATGKPR